MAKRWPKLLLILGPILACIFLGWWLYSLPNKPSALIADDDLLQKIHKGGLPKDYVLIAAKAAWNHDPVTGRFERSFDCTVGNLKNAPFDGNLVCDAFEKWVAGLVSVQSVADDPGGPNEVCRVIRYAAPGTTGQLRYVLKPPPGAAPDVNEKKPPSPARSLEIRITEQTKQ